jgi:hypothetical protein
LPLEITTFEGNLQQIKEFIYHKAVHEKHKGEKVDFKSEEAIEKNEMLCN